MAENSPISGIVDESAPSEIIDHTTVSFMEKTMARVGKMRANTTVSNEKKEMLRASLTETEKESVKATMAEVEANPVEGHLDQSVMLQEQVKIRNAKFNS